MKYIALFLFNILVTISYLVLWSLIIVITYAISIIWHFSLKSKFFSKEDMFQDFTEYRVSQDEAIGYTGYGLYYSSHKDKAYYYKNWFAYIWGFSPTKIENI